MNKDIRKLDKLISEAAQIAPSIKNYDIDGSYGKVTDENLSVNESKRWEIEARALINRYSEMGAAQVQLISRDLEELDSRKWQFHSRSIFIHMLKGMLENLRYFLESGELEYSKTDEQKEASALNNIQTICSRFHGVARQLRARHSSRATLEIEDEYDVQDLFHSLLKLFFDDIRDEEWAPSYAGSCSRVDFLLKQEKVVVEVKKTRKGLGAKEVGEQLLIDIQRYQSHPDCNSLICFVYDPEARIANPKGIENDLTKEFEGMKVSVLISPKDN
jgi:hypothetical protein